MLLDVLKAIFGGAGVTQKIGDTVARGFQLGAVLVALAPLAMFLRESKDEIFIALTYGDLAFWGVILGAFMFVTTRILHGAPPPQ